ncbi:uncharacterized [Tachysurus ichikawai]
MDNAVLLDLMGNAVLLDLLDNAVLLDLMENAVMLDLLDNVVLLDLMLCCWISCAMLSCWIPWVMLSSDIAQRCLFPLARRPRFVRHRAIGKNRSNISVVQSYTGSRGNLLRLPDGLKSAEGCTNSAKLWLYISVPLGARVPACVELLL